MHILIAHSPCTHFWCERWCRQGDIYYICPVVPFGMKIPMLLIRKSLRPDDATPEAVLRWLQEVSGTRELGAPLQQVKELQLWRDTNQTVEVVPHALPDTSLALQVRAAPALHF